MSEQPPTPVEIIFAAKGQVDQRTQLQKDAEQLLDCYVRVYGQLAGLVEEASMLTKRQGKTAILGALDPVVAQAITDSLAAVQTMWEACSPYPFPPFPADPVPPEEPESEE